jgi:hypothetical protein
LAALLLTAFSYSLTPPLLLGCTFLKRVLQSSQRGKQVPPIISEHQQVLPTTKGALFVFQILLKASDWKCYLDKATQEGQNKAHFKTN